MGKLNLMTESIEVARLGIVYQLATLRKVKGFKQLLRRFCEAYQGMEELMRESESEPGSKLVTLPQIETPKPSVPGTPPIPACLAEGRGGL